MPGGLRIERALAAEGLPLGDDQILQAAGETAAGHGDEGGEVLEE